MNTWAPHSLGSYNLYAHPSDYSCAKPYHYNLIPVDSSPRPLFGRLEVDLYLKKKRTIQYTPHFVQTIAYSTYNYDVFVQLL